MANRLQRHVKILHGLDMSAIIEIPDDDNDASGNDQPILPPTNRPRRATRQVIHGERSALYSAKYHPMDDVMRPASAKRYYGKAFGPDEDADSDEAMTNVRSSEQKDEENSKPTARHWSIGVRHSSRASSQKPVNYNMKRHPQDAQLRLLDKVVFPIERSTVTTLNYTDHRSDLFLGNDESSVEKEEVSFDKTLIPTKRTIYAVMHSAERRSVVIEDSDGSSTETEETEEEEDKKNTPPAVDAGADAEDDHSTSKANEDTAIIQLDHSGTPSKMEGNWPDPPLAPAVTPTSPTSNVDDEILDELASSLQQGGCRTPPVGNDKIGPGSLVDQFLRAERGSEQSTRPNWSTPKARLTSATVPTRASSFAAPSWHPWRSRPSPVRTNNPITATTNSSPAPVSTNTLGGRPRQPLTASRIFSFNAEARPATAPTSSNANSRPTHPFSFTLGRFVSPSEGQKIVDNASAATATARLVGAPSEFNSSDGAGNPFGRPASTFAIFGQPISSEGPAANLFAATATASAFGALSRPNWSDEAAIHQMGILSSTVSIFGPGPITGDFGTFGAPSTLYSAAEPLLNPSPTSMKNEVSEKADDDNDDASEEEPEDAQTVPRFPLSELDPLDIIGSPSKTPSSRSSSIRSNYPDRRPTLTNPIVAPAEPILPANPAVVNPFGLVTQTGPDGREHRLSAGVNHAKFTYSSSFAAGQPRDISSPMAQVPASTIGISRPRGAPQTRRRPGKVPVHVRPDNIFSYVRDRSGQDYPNEGRYYDQENCDPYAFDATYSMNTSDEENERVEDDVNWPGNGTGEV